MNTHRRAWTLRAGRAGAVAALVAGAVTGIATPALADDPDVQITVLNSGTLAANQRTQMQFTVRNNNQQPTVFAIQVSTFDGLTCQGDCNIPARLLDRDQTATIGVTLVAGNLPPGQNRSGQIRVTAQAPNGDDDADERQFTVQAAAQPQVQTVKKVSGQIIDVASGDAIPGAIVAMRDSEDHNFTTEANDKGRFSFTGSTQRPIAPGRIFIAVGKTGFGDITKNFDVKAGQSKTDIRIPLISTASPSASPTAADTGPPASDGALPADDGQVAANPSANEGSGTLTWALILAGGLLVALGVGALVLLLVRRRQEKDDGSGVGAAGPGGPGGRGGYAGADATRVTPAGMGAGPMAGRPDLANAPTMLQAPIRDEYPDPYGAPPVVRPAGGYGAAGQPGWAGNGYADATQVGGYPGGPPASAGPGSPVGYGATRPGAHGSPAGPPTGYGAANGQSSGPPAFGGPLPPVSGGYGASGGPSGPPYGAAPQQPGYGSAATPPGYGPDAGPAAPYGSPAAPRPGYGGPGGHDAGPQDTGGFAPAGRGDGGYGRDFGERYDEPTGHFRGEDAGQANGRAPGGYGPAGGAPPPEPYDQRGGGYQPPPSYERRGGYEADYGGQPPYDRQAQYESPGGYDRPPSYEPPPSYEQPRYDSPPRYDPPPPYDPPPYDAPQYDQPGGYDRPPGGYGGQGGQGYDQRGYEGGGYGSERGYEPRAGYDQGGYPGEPRDPREPGPPPSRHAAPPQARGERRPLDWLDD